MLNPLHLRTLSVVLRTGSFAAAGRHLGYTGSAVSQQMSALESASGLLLFERGAQGVRPTPEAQLLSERAVDTLGAFATLQDAVGEIASGRRGRLGLGSFPTASEVLIPGALARFGRDFGDVEVRFEDGEPHQLVTRLLEGDLDVIVVFRYDLVPQIWPAGCLRTPLLTEPVRLLVPDRAGLPDGPVPLSDFADRSWISTREGTAGTLALERACAAAGFAPQIRYRSNDYDVVRSFVRSGLGVAAVPRLAYLGRVGLRDLDVTGLAVHRHVEALTMSDRHNPATARMLDALRSAARTALAGS
ncbi:MAG: LysR family transcriptional regulator [Propionibacteriaceae bacterium]